MMGDTTMTDYTPTTDHMRGAFMALEAFGPEIARNRAELFDRWLAAHDAEVAANALREAMDDAENTDPRDEPFLGLDDMAAWLRRRADRIEREAGTNTTNPELGSIAPLVGHGVGEALARGVEHERAMQRVVAAADRELGSSGDGHDDRCERDAVAVKSQAAPGVWCDCTARKPSSSEGSAS